MAHLRADERIPVGGEHALDPHHIHLCHSRAAPLARLQQNRADGAASQTLTLESGQQPPLGIVEHEAHAAPPAFVLDVDTRCRPVGEIMAEAQQLPLSARPHTRQRRVVSHRLGYGDGARRHAVERLLQRVGIAELRTARAHESGVDVPAPLGRTLGEAPYKGIEQLAARLDGTLPPGILRLDFGRPRQAVERGPGATRELRIGLSPTPRRRHSHRPASASGLGLQRGRHIVVDRQQIRSHFEEGGR